MTSDKPKMFFLGQTFPTLEWHVIPVEPEQGLAMRERKVPHVYDSSRQAYAVCESLEQRRTGKIKDTEPVTTMELLIRGEFPTARVQDCVEVLTPLGWTVVESDVIDLSDEDKPEEPIPVCKRCDHCHSEEPDWERRWRRCRVCGCEDGGHGAIK